MTEEGLSVEYKQCIVCVENIDGEERLHAFGPCNHPGVCSLCYLRLRQLMKVDTCVLCKTVMDRVMVCKADNIRAFEEFQVWGDNAGPEYDWDDKSRMFLPKAYNRSFVRPLQEHRCGVENCLQPRCNNLTALDKHLREKHRLNLCKVCLKNRKVFIMEQARYTNLELQQHIVSGDPKLGQSGHPRCEFCKTRFYDAAQLHEHLVKDHYSCHICEKRGILHKYYRDYADLERHFRSDHHLCEEEECLQKKFVVFDSEIDLTAHMLQMHPNRPIKRQIQVNFRIKRSNWDGTGDEQRDEDEKKQDEEVHEWTYEGEIGEQTQPPEVLAARREAARRAAREGGMIGLPDTAPASAETADEFPTLSGGDRRAGSGGSRQTSGWASLANNRPRSEDFPALRGRGGGGGGGGDYGSSGVTFRSAVEAYPTRAQEIAMSGPGDGGWCFDYPMPLSEETGGSGVGGGGGRGRVAGIWNMKLKVDKKAAKRSKQKAAAAAATAAAAPCGGSRETGKGGGVETKQQQQNEEASRQARGTPTTRASSSASPPLSARSPSPPPPPRAVAAAVVEDFPLAPGMRAPPLSAGVGPHPAVAIAAASNGPTLAQSIAAQQQSSATAEAGGRGGGGVPSVVMQLKELLGEEAFSEVKEISGSYRSGWIMPGEYFRAMEERLPEDRFRELFEGLISTLPDEDKRTEMQVLLTASSSVKAKAAARKNAKKKAPPAAAAAAAAPQPTPLATREANGDAAGAATAAPQESWPEIGHPSKGVGGVGNGKAQGKVGKGIGAASNGIGKAKAGGARGGGAKTSPSSGVGVKTTSGPGSAATWLKAMGTTTGGVKTGGTGISIVRPSARSSSTTSTITTAAGGYNGSRLQCNPGVRDRSESPLPGAPLRRRDEDEAAGIGQAGASWATLGGSGFKVSSKGKAMAASVKISREDFPGLPAEGGGGGAALRVNPADFPGLPAEGAGMRGLGGATTNAFKVKPQARSPPPSSQQHPPTREDFPGLPTPAPPPPGMEKVDWGSSDYSAGQQRGGGGTSNGGVGAAVGGGKGAKKKNKHKAEKEALKGMAFGFR